MKTQNPSDFSSPPTVFWPIMKLPETVAQLVSTVQGNLPGVEFGALRLEVRGEGTLAELHLIPDVFLPGNEDDRGEQPMHWQIDGVWHWSLSDLPRRFSFLLGFIRARFPGVGFDSIAVVLFRGHLGFRRLLPQEAK